MLKPLFVLLLHLLPTLALPLNVTSLEDSDNCFRHEPHHFNPIVALDCLHAAAFIKNEPEYTEPQVWYHSAFDPEAERIWFRDTCDVSLQAKQLYATDTFKPENIYTTACALIRDCVMQGWEVGGQTDIGPKHVFKVVVEYHGLFKPHGPKTLRLPK